MASQVSERAQVRPYGGWRSPITADLIVAGKIMLSQVAVDGDDIYWIEQRPAEAGRNVVVRHQLDGSTEDVTPQGFNARTRVHEYGGGAYLVRDGVVWFTNFADQRLYRQDPGQAARPITREGDIRHADMVLDERRGRLIAVREDHSTGSTWAINSIVSISATGGREETLVGGNDFYSTPRLSPSGNQLCWLTWNHPNMPWDGTELWVAVIADDGILQGAQRVAGGSNESIFAPSWSPDGTLYFMSDRSNWWNLYRWHAQAVERVVEISADLGTPQWAFGMSTYAFARESRIACQVRSGGLTRLATIDLDTGKLTTLDTPYTAFLPFMCARGSTNQAITIGGSPTEPLSLIAVDLDSGKTNILRRSVETAVKPAYLSIPEALQFPTEGDLTAYAFFYLPRNPDFAAPRSERPPLIVYVHGGPTGAMSNALDLEQQFWTSRGFAYLVVNYGGSAGFGRAYRERLNGQWGVVDVHDAINAARYVIDRDLADGHRVAITGGSAGGYTVLRALTTTDFFQAGASHYGISEMEAFHGDTHKFESRYDERLIGRWPEDRAVYHERSALYSVDRIQAPLILFQGLEDEVVPPNQAELIVAALRKKGLPVAYVAFEGEQHGFRIAKNIKRALEGELYFYSKVFGFELADPVEPILIENQRPMTPKPTRRTTVET